MKVLAAGSLIQAMALIKEAYPGPFEAEYGPAGFLRERIEQGERADLFLSANTAHPEKLLKAGLVKKAIPFAANTLCLIVREGLEGRDWFELISDPRLKVGITVPGKDPSGDYAFEFFDRIEKDHPPVGARLKERSRQLFGGGPGAGLPIPPGENPVSFFIGAGEADLFVAYKSIALSGAVSPLSYVDIPPAYNIRALYAMGIITGAGEALGEFLCSSEGQDCLIRAGFTGISNSTPPGVSAPPDSTAF
ncbi:MAG: substrate-binding domain-containing protein [Spirochaetales bacterium]|jgi:molybdate transport system substrate-binding protein|nr:substrate-binding domain-containing protein [Spirochaetales bacterium]